MPYMLAPGARLVVGPGGKLEETLGLGACCAPCASSGSVCVGFGDTPAPKKTKAPGAILATRMNLAAAVAAPASSTHKLLLWGGVAAATGVGLLVIRRAMRRGRRH